MKVILLAGWVMALTSCATLTGNADYRYSSTDPATGRTVTVRINSGRDLPQGGELEIGPDGTLKVKAGALQGNDAATNALAGVVSAIVPVIAPMVAGKFVVPVEQPKQ